MTEELKFLLQICNDAKNLITDDFKVKAKGENGDLVTNFDFEIEQLIIDAIKKHYPEFGIVSEEFNSEKALTNNCFVIDPIDGTINFANGLPDWCIQVACIKNGKVVASVINCPALNEVYYADVNGAFMNGKPIHVSDLPIEKSLYAEGPMPSRKAFETYGHRIRHTMCAGVNHARVASGKLGATVYRVDTPWDYVMGQYIVKQAGGNIHSENGLHIAANSQKFVEFIKSNENLKKQDLQCK